MTNGHLPHLSAGRFIDPDTDLKTPERDRIGRERLLFHGLVNYAVGIVIDAIYALVGYTGIVLVDPVELVVRTPRVVDASQLGL